MADQFNHPVAKWLCPKNQLLFGITISRDTTLYNLPSSLIPAWLIRHENCHKNQYVRHGWFGFVCKWFIEVWEHTYPNNPLELEARAMEGDHSI